MTVEGISAAARLAEPGEAVGFDELALATRNHGLPLEALRYEVTPPGLHYLLIHYDIPALDQQTWRLQIGGRVRRSTEFDLDALRAFEPRTVRVTMECAGNGRARLRPRPVSQPWLVEAVGTADWTGVPLHVLLADTDVDPAAVEVVFTGADHGVERGIEQDYQRSLPLIEALGEDVLVAYGMNGHDLPPQHGYPVRLVVPGWYGMAHVKWLSRIEAVDQPFLGFQQSVAYRIRQQPGEPGAPVQRIAPRALMVPPGFPDFMSRTRIVPPGPVELMGRVWSGGAAITGVEVSNDGGSSWEAAIVEPTREHRWAWRRWQYTWIADPGSYVLATRAIMADGAVQSNDGVWNRGGFGNNAPQTIAVVCTTSMAVSR